MLSSFLYNFITIVIFILKYCYILLLKYYNYILRYNNIIYIIYSITNLISLHDLKITIQYKLMQKNKRAYKCPFYYF